jgi:hypothetical protein
MSIRMVAQFANTTLLPATYETALDALSAALIAPAQVRVRFW